MEESVNRAIEAHYGTLGLTAEAAEAIRDRAGPDALEKVREISSFANTPEHWIYAESHDRAYRDVQRLLRERFPFLSADALQRVATSAAYGWK